MQHPPLRAGFVVLALLWPGLTQAGFPGVHVAESLVVGVNLTVAPEGELSRLGWGLDFGWQRQWYTQQGVTVEEDVYYVWPDAHVAPNLGVAAHLWRLDGAWWASVGGRAAIVKPLRVGLQGGWWPGAGVAAEAGYLVSTAGFAGLDLRGGVEATWLQASIGQVLTLQGWQGRRSHLGASTPTESPRLWQDSENVGWRPPE